MFKKLKINATHVVLFGLIAWLSPVIAAEILVAQIAPFTGLPSNDPTEMNEGAQAYFDQINRQGGISGTKINFQKFDDQFKPEVFSQQFSLALKRKAVALICPEGSPVIAHMLKEKLLDSANIVVINPVPGADAFRNPGSPKLFHIRASDGEQYKRMIAHGRVVGNTDLLVLYQNVPATKAGFTAISQAAPELGYTKISGVESKPDEASLNVAAKAIVTIEPQTVIVIGQPKFMADAIKQLRMNGYTRAVLATSYLTAPLLVKVAGESMARGVGIVQTYPNPSGRTLPLHQDFQKTMAAFAPNVKSYSAFHLEGYLAARVLVDALTRAKGNTSSEALIAALRGAGELNYGGFRVDFSKGNVGGKWTDMSVIDAYGKLRY
jgi:branched-chain amino acid transport system substrate-binding protein